MATIKLHDIILHVSKSLRARDILEHVLKTIWETSIELRSAGGVIPSSVGYIGVESHNVFCDRRVFWHFHALKGSLGGLAKVSITEHLD